MQDKSAPRKRPTRKVLNVGVPIRYSRWFNHPEISHLSLTGQQLRQMTDQDLFEEGVNFFNAGKYYEAHEVWEDAWRLEEGSRRRFYQGLIQAAVGLYHLSRSNTTGARSQLAKSIRNLSDYAASEHRIDAPDLIAQLSAVRDEMRIRNVRIARLK